ncbi:hypothetical protein BLNAU_5120 [Blattamonas nauphoetae]|uniref:Uncharacterized protein n=1 Tax=Blattamonas nauphoetae TaxID=2049346 RepID=A0ABQ9Y837_9EUKA|nr:hypothetical protein BLNAU_5120 [Blattamonas nauphoetae]
MKLFVFILVFGVFVSHPSTPPIFTSHVATSKPNDEEQSVFACVVELIGPTTIQIHLFGENLRLGEYCFSIREGIEEPERFTLNFDTRQSSGITSEAQTLDANHPLQPGHTYLLTTLELNEPELKKISFMRNSKPVVIWLSVQPDPTTPVISYVDLLLAPDRISLFFEVYGVNIDSLTLIKFPSLSNDVSGSVSVELPTHSSPYLCSSNPIHPEDFFFSKLMYNQSLNSIELIGSDSQTIVYPHTVTAAQEDLATTMIVTAIVVQLYTDDTAQFYLTGKHLKPGLYKLSWRQTFMDIEYGSATLQFPTQIMTSIVSEKIALSDLDQFDNDCLAYRIEPIDFAPPIRVVVPGKVSSGVYIEVFGAWGYVTTIASVKCELSIDSSSFAQINVTVLMFSAGEYYATFSDENQNQYTVQLWFDQSTSVTMFSSSLPISVGPSNTDLVYGAVYTDFKVFRNGIELPSEMTSFTAPSDQVVVTVTKITYKHVTDTSFCLEFTSNHVFSGTFEVTFSADGNQPFTKEIEVFALPGTFLVQSEVLEIDGSQFRFKTVYTITSIDPKSDRTEILFTQLLFTIPPVRPTPIDDRSIVDLSGSEDLGCGYGTEQPCRNLIQAIQNQIVIPEVFVLYSLLTVEVKNGGVVKEYFDTPEISVPLLICGNVGQGVVPTIEIQSNPQIILTGGSEDAVGLTMLDLEFSFASDSGFRPFFVVKGGEFFMQRCVISESNSAHSSFLLVESGDAKFYQSEIKNIRAVDTILDMSASLATLSVDTMTITNCGQSTSNSLLVFGNGFGDISNMEMTGCEAEEAPISLSSQNIITVFNNSC